MRCSAIQICDPLEHQLTGLFPMVPFSDGSCAARRARKSGATYRSLDLEKKKNEKKKQKRLLFLFRIEKRGLNLMRSMQQGISTHYNTRLGI